MQSIVESVKEIFHKGCYKTLYNIVSDSLFALIEFDLIVVCVVFSHEVSNLRPFTPVLIHG
jgi:hypothetical protein